MKVFIENVIVEGEEKGKLYLESDSMQFILKEYTGAKHTDKQGVERELFKTLGYFTNIQSALNHFLKMKIMASTATTIYELHQDIQSIRRYIESTFDYNITTKPVEVEEAV